MALSQNSRPSTFELLMNPIRMRIIQQVMLNKRLTAHQIAEAQSEIPLTTLYRHLNMLVEGGILVVAEERRIRGTMERVYELAANEQTKLDPQKSKEQTIEDHMQLFTTFSMHLLDGFRRYLEQAGEKADYATDGVRYRQYPLHLSDAEFGLFFDELVAVIERWQALEPSAERSARLFSLITLPDKSKKG